MADALDWQAYYDQQARQVFAPVNAYIDRQTEDRRAKAQQQFANQNAIQVAQQQADAKEARDAAAVGMTIEARRAAQREAADLQLKRQQAQAQLEQQQAQEGSLDSRLAYLGLDPSGFPDENAKRRAIGEAVAKAAAAKTPPPKPDTTGVESSIKYLFDHMPQLSIMDDASFDGVLSTIQNDPTRATLIAAREAAKEARVSVVNELAAELSAKEAEAFDASFEGQAQRQVDQLSNRARDAAMEHFDIDPADGDAKAQLAGRIAALGEKEVRDDPFGSDNSFKIGGLVAPTEPTASERREGIREALAAQARMAAYAITSEEVKAARKSLEGGGAVQSPQAQQSGVEPQPEPQATPSAGSGDTQAPLPSDASVVEAPSPAEGPQGLTPGQLQIVRNILRRAKNNGSSKQWIIDKLLENGINPSVITEPAARAK